MPVPPMMTVTMRTLTRTLAVMSVTRTEVGVLAIHRRTLLGVLGSTSEVVVVEVVMIRSFVDRAST